MISVPPSCYLFFFFFFFLAGLVVYLSVGTSTSAPISTLIGRVGSYGVSSFLSSSRCSILGGTVITVRRWISLDLANFYLGLYFSNNSTSLSFGNTISWASVMISSYGGSWGSSLESSSLKSLKYSLISPKSSSDKILSLSKNRMAMPTLKIN